jgi:uncharacterized membrane protein
MSKKSENKTTKEMNGNPFTVKPKKKSGPFTWLRSRFFTGVIVTAPMAITIGLVWWLITFVDAKVKPLIPEQWNPETYTKIALPGLGLIVAVVFLVFVGMIAANLIGKSVVDAGESLIGRVPLVRNIHMAFKQIFETLATSQSDNFKEVVMIEYPRKDAWAVGFITASVKGDMALKNPGLGGVFVPTTPNPTSGFLIYVKREDTIALDMSVEDGAKLIISAGLVVPDPKEMKTLAESEQEAVEDAKELTSADTESADKS